VCVNAIFPQSNADSESPKRGEKISNFFGNGEEGSKIAKIQRSFIDDPPQVTPKQEVDIFQSVVICWLTKKFCQFAYGATALS